MPRKITPLVSGETYHIYNRGTDKRDIFLNKNDYLRFYQSLNVFNTKEPIINFDSALVGYKNNKFKDKLVEVIAYALLPNHYHLVVRQVEDGGISEYVKRVAGGYTSYFNQKEDRSGVLFQGKFKRVHVDNDSHFNYLISYVNENHSVHNLNFEREICHTSSLHYQGVYKSILINAPLSSYDKNSAVELAQQIYNQRQLLKREQILE